MDPRRLAVAAIFLAAVSCAAGAQSAGTRDARAPGAHIGISKQLIFGGLSGGFPLVRARFRVANYGDQVVSNISITENLNGVYGSGNYVHITDPNQLAGEGSLNYNAAFDGNVNTAMISPGSSLAPGEFVIFEISTRVTTLTDQGFGFGIYRNQVTVTGTDPALNPVSDVSTDGPDPDPDGNDNPGDNAVVSEINLANRSAIGVAKTAAVAGNLATFDLYLEAFGTSALNSLTLLDDLDAVFGAGNYSIVAPPTLIAGPGTLTLNGGFDGSADGDILSAASTLAAGATAQIRFQVAVTNVVNRGLGLGIYRNQANALARLPNSVVLADISVSGTDPDPDADGDPTDDASITPVSMAPTAAVGVAKAAAISGNQVTIDLYLENLGSATSSSIGLVDNLNAVFGAGNYALIGAPSFIDNPGTLTLNPGYDGSSQTNLLGPGSSLVSGDTAQIRFVVNVTTISNQGFGVGVYQNQASVTGVDPGGRSLTDLSHAGTDPDPSGDGDPTGASENTPTTIPLTGSSVGVALQSFVNGNDITFDYTIENLGATPVNNLAVSHPLGGAFGTGNFMVSGAPTLLEDPGTVVLNSGYDGTSSPSVINPSSLAGKARARIRIVVTVTNITNQGSGLGVYPTQSSMSGTDLFGTAVNDFSDNGIIVDANGNGNAGDTGEDDPTISVIGTESILGAAMQASLAGNVATFDVYLENLGNTNLSNVRALNNLDAVFGAGNYGIAAAPVFIDNPGTLSLNAGFNGSSSPDLLAGGTLNVADTAQIRFSVTITNPVNVGLGLGVYANQVAAFGSGAGGTLAADYSDDGIDPDANGNGNPSDSGESDPTIVTYSTSSIGVAKLATVNGDLVTFDFFVENLGSSPLTGISLLEDLNGVFGAGNYQIATPLGLISPPRNLATNPSFNGSGITQMLAPGSAVDPGITEQLRLVVRVLTPVDQGSGLGVYSNQVAISSAQGVSDLSDSGSNPDPNGNSFAGDPGENDPTAFAVAAANVSISISDGTASAVPGSVLTYTTVASNLNGSTATDVMVSTSLGAPLAACSTTSVAAGGATGNDPGPLTGNLNDPGITLPVGSTVTYTTNCGIPAGATGTVLSSANISTAVVDPVSANNSASDSDTLTPQSDLSITKTDGQASAIPGTAISYTITVQASGPSDATAVSIVDNFPSALSAVSYTASATGGASGFTAAGLGSIADTVNLPAGSSITYMATTTVRATATGTLSNTASVIAPVGLTDPTPGNNSATDTDTLTAETDLAITKTDGSASAVSGASVTYTIVARNGGPSVAAAATVADTFPADLSGCSWTCSAGTGGSCTAAGSGNIADAVNLPVGISATFIATCTLDPGATSDLVNTATVAAGAGATDSVPGNNSATDTDTLVTSADLAVALTDSPDPAVVGSTISYVATVNNLGPSSAQDVSLSLPLPALTNFVSTTSSAGASCTSPAVGSNGTVSCTWSGATAPGPAASRTMTVVAQVPLATPDQTVLTATASAGSATVDPNGSNNSASTTTTVESTADLSIILAASPDPVGAGSQLSYLATVTNGGPAAAQDITVTLPLPAGTTLASTNAGAGGSCNAVSPVVCTWAGSTPAAGLRTVTIVVNTDPTLQGTLTATATASALSIDPVAANNVATTSTNVSAIADLVLSLSSSATEVAPNVPITLTATSLNQGPSGAQDVSITMTLAPDLRYSSHAAGAATCSTPQMGNSGVINCTWPGASAPGTSRILQVVGYNNAPGTASVSASTTSNTPDPVDNNNLASVSVQVSFLIEEIPALDELGLLLLGALAGLTGLLAVSRRR